MSVEDITALPYYALYSRLPQFAARMEQTKYEEFKICCPFHREDTPSCHINLDTGRWYCFGRCSRGGGPKEIETVFGKVDNQSFNAKRKREKAPPQPPIDPAEVEQHHRRLLNNDDALISLEHMGIHSNTVERFKIGWTGERFVWPVIDEGGNYRNLRMYKPKATGGDKVVSYSAYIEGEQVTYGAHNTRLFPLQALDKQTCVFLCEGEKDALCLNDLGFAAVTATCGAGQWQPDTCNGPLAGKDVVIVYDIDDKGKSGASKVSILLKRVCRRVLIAHIPEEDLPDNGDVADFIAKDETFARNWFQQQLDVVSTLADIDELEELSGLGETKLPRLHDHAIKVDAHIIGKETTPYIAERGYHLVCPQSKGKMCDACPMNELNGEMEIIVNPDSKDLLYTIERTDLQIHSWIGDKAGIPRGCTVWDCQSVEEHKSSVEKILLSTTVDQRAYEGPSEYIQQMAYVVDAPVIPNSVYTLAGRMTNHPKDQSNVFIVTRATTSRLSIDTFTTTPEMHEQLKFFQPAEWTVDAITERLERRFDDLAANVTHIYRRPLTHLLIDLVSHSLLRFECFGRIPDRCWLEGYVGGDTRQGKSEAAKRLHAHYRAGELVVSENASLAGILGGAAKLGNGEWMVSWGKCPLNDRGWVTFDECQNIHLSIMGALSGMRSSGVAEIDKIRVERVNARARIVWLSNPRSDHAGVDSLSQGVLLAKDVFGRPEDIARLDLMSVVRARDIDGSVVHEDHSHIKHEHTTDLCHMLLMFAWSRTTSQIEFTPEAELAARDVSDRIATKYDCDIKLVEAMEQRFKVARVAGALAALTYSTEDGENLRIKECHVQAAESVLNRLFDDPAMSYNEYAKTFAGHQSVRNSNEIWTWAGNQPEELLRAVLTQTTIRLFDVQNYGDFNREEAQSNVSFLLQQRALFTNDSLDYVKNAEFVAIIRKSLAENHFAKAKTQPNSRRNGSTNGKPPAAAASI